MLYAGCRGTGSCGSNSGVSSDVSGADTASAPQEEIIPLDVSISDSEMEVGVCTVHELSATGGDRITFRSSDQSVATVDDHGTVTGIAVGQCEITAENEFGNSASCHITVKRTIFITVDDGPMRFTESILRKLDEHNIKATFFVLNTYNRALLKTIHDKGHTIGLHAYNHDFSVCYKSEYSYYTDLEKLKDVIEEYTGERPNILRFPGGTSNHVMDMLGMRRMVSGLDDLGYRAFDWTASTGDSGKVPVTYREAANNALANCFHDFDIILMHDKETSPRALDIMIPELKRRGYTFETLDHMAEHSYMFKTWYESYKGEETVPCEQVKIQSDSCELAVGQTLTLPASMTPDTTTDYLRFVSDDPSIVSIALDGTLTAKRPGTTTVRAIASSGQEALCTVTVKAE